MYTLNLTRINESSPYEVWQTSEEDFYFLTDFDVLYRINLEEFFASNPDILLYQCEIGDNRQAMRDRLFLRWFKEYEKSDKLLAHQAAVAEVMKIVFFIIY